MVEGGEAADDRQHGIRMTEVVTRHAGQMLDLAHDVVAEVTDEPAVQRGQVGHRRRAVRGEHSLDGAQDALISGHLGGQITGDLDAIAPRDERRGRPAPHEREAAPALAVLDRLEHEPGPVADELCERRDRRLEISEQLRPDGDDGVVAREPLELGPVRSDVHPNARKKQECSPVWHAPPPSCSTTNRRVSPSQS